MKTSRLVILGLAAGVALAMPSMGWGATTPGMVGSPHDFTTGTNFWVSGTTNWVPNNNVCEECHTIHKADTAYKNVGPLWAHNAPDATPGFYTPYTSPQLKADGYASGGTPGWSSLACLSCHDGNTAINQQNGGAVPSSPISLPGSFLIAAGGNDLSGVHPIGIDYNTAQAADGYLNSSSLALSSVASGACGADGSKTILQEMLFDESGMGGGPSMLECASCHDIHQQKGVSGTATAAVTASGGQKYRDALKIGTTTSSQALCLTCHIK